MAYPWGLEPEDIAYSELPTSSRSPYSAERDESDFSRGALSIASSEAAPQDKLQELADFYASSSWKPGVKDLVAGMAQQIKMEAGIPLEPDRVFQAYAQSARTKLPYQLNSYLPDERDQKIDEWAENVKAEMGAKGGVTYALSANENNAYVDQLASSWKREGNVSKSATEEYLKRFFGGAVDAAGGLVLQAPEVTQKITDPRYDDDNLAQFMSGLGNGTTQIGAAVGLGAVGGAIWTGRMGRAAGALVGAFGGSAAQNYTETWENVYQQTGNREAATRAGLNTWPSWALDGISTLVEAKGLTEIGGAVTRGAKIDALTKTILGSVATSAATEGVTEGIQSLINQSAEAPFTGKEVSTEQAFREGLIGAEVGGVLGGVSSVLGGKAQPEIVDDSQQPKEPLSASTRESLRQAAKFSPEAAVMLATDDYLISAMPGMGTMQPNTQTQDLGPDAPTEAKYRIADVADTHRALNQQVNFGSAIRAGSLEQDSPGSGAEAHQEAQSGLIRTKDDQNLDVLAHEVAHGMEATFQSPTLPKNRAAVEKRFKDAWASIPIPDGVRANLEFLGMRLYGKEPDNGWVSEGWAELVRLVLTGNDHHFDAEGRMVALPSANDNGTTAQAVLDQVPEAVKWLNETALPQIAKNIDARKELYSRQVAPGLIGKIDKSLGVKRPLEKALKDTSGKQFLDLFAAAQEQTKGYYQQNLLQKGAAQQDRRVLERTWVSDLQKGLKDFMSEDHIHQWVDRLKFLEDFQNLAEDIHGQRLPENMRPFDSALAALSEPVGNTRAWMVGTPIRLGGAIKANHENFQQILGLAPRSMNQHDLSNYAYGLEAKYRYTQAAAERTILTDRTLTEIAGRRAEALTEFLTSNPKATQKDLDKWNKERDVFDRAVLKEALAELPNRNPGITEEQADAWISKEKQYPELLEFKRRLEAWNGAWLESGRGISESGDAEIDAIQKSRQMVKDFNPDIARVYLPLYRVIDDATRGNPARGQVGSSRAVQPIIETLPMAMIRWTDHLMRGQSMDAAIKISEEVPGLGRWLTRIGSKPEGIDINTGEQFTAPIVTDKNDKFVYGKKSRLVQGASPGLATMTNTWYELDERLGAGMRLGGDYHFQNAFFQTQLFEYAFIKPKQMVQLGVLGLSVPWQIGVAIPRGLGELYFLRGENDGTLRQMLGAYFGIMGRAAKDAVSVARGGAPDPVMERLRDWGIAAQLETFAPQNQKENEKLINIMRLKGFNDVQTAGNWWHAMKQILAAPEIAKKGAAGHLREIAEFGKVDLSREYTQAEKFKLISAIRGMSGDHMRLGNAKLARFMAMVTPFLNGQIGGTVKIVEAMRTPVYWQRAISMSIAAGLLTLWHRTEDKEWWDEIPDGQKYKYWFINPPGTKTLIKIPKAFQLDLPTSTVEALIDSMGPDGANRIKGELLDGLQYDTFGFATLAGAPLLKSLLNQMYGADIKTDFPIESAAMMRRVKPERYNEYTTETAKALGRTFGLSPARIEKLVQDLSGYSLLGITKALENTVGVRQLPPGASPDLDAFGSLFPAKGIEFGNAKSISKFYENYNQISFYSVQDTEIDNELRKQMRDAGKAMSILNSVLKQLPSGDQRSAIYKQRLDIARKANAAFETRTVDRETFKEIKKTAKAQGIPPAAPAQSPVEQLS